MTADAELNIESRYSLNVVCVEEAVNPFAARSFGVAIGSIIVTEVDYAKCYTCNDADRDKYLLNIAEFAIA